MPVKPPRKPFDDYKWQWASFQPTEGLNDPAVHLGVLRVLADNEGRSPNSAELYEDLGNLEAFIKGRIAFAGKLARSPERNLLRNAGQYWKATGVLGRTDGGIMLTQFGRDLAEGKIQRTEYAAAVIASLELPNRRIQSPSVVKRWDDAALAIRPLKLILEILAELMRRNAAEAYLSVTELSSLVIPLAGAKAPIDTHARAIREYRAHKIDVGEWPDCAPGANDRRMAREFLLFLWHYGFVQRDNSDLDVFRADTSSIPEMAAIAELAELSGSEADAAHRARSSATILFVERKRVLMEVMSRPEQAKFRENVLRGYSNACLLTGETTSAVLEAAHLIPVKHNGSDELANGLCLRSDIHTLFDAGYIKIAPTGDVRLSDFLKRSVTYATLPSKVILPRFVEMVAVEWRWKLD